MFDQINGLPVHVLVVHGAVVFVPLLALGAIVYAALPRWRSRVGWAVALLAIAAPLATLAAKLSGEELEARLLAQGVSGRGAEIIGDHAGFGNLTFYFALALGVVSLVMVFLTSRERTLPRMANLGLTVVTVVLAAISSYYVFQTGDSGATAVWGTY